MSGTAAGHIGGGSQQSPKRTWKLQEFVAHSSNVKCLSLGHKSGRVLVTGGEDKKVNLWAVGKPNCIMSLSGHNTSIECVRFGHTEELVCAGSLSGTLKIWDLEAAKLIRTLTGHKSAIKCVDFHPYGDFLASGSCDTSVRLWDTRRKGSIFSYKGHSGQVNSVKFSPDGQWIASGGDGVKLWDLRAGKQLTDLVHQPGAITEVVFHPHEFLLASGSEDRSVALWDLEKFTLVGGEERERGPVRTIFFHPDGESLLTCTSDTLRVCSWEPLQTQDIVSLSWGKVADITITNNQLVGASHHSSHVQLWVVDLKQVQPFSGVVVPEKDTSRVSLRSTQPVRRSFVKDKSGAGMTETKRQQVRIEECSDKSGTDGDDSDAVSSAEIMNLTHHENIFQPRVRQLNRTPPPPDQPFEAPVEPEMPQPVKVLNPTKFHGNKSSRPSPSGTRRSSQPNLPSGYIPGGSVPQQSGRRGSTTGLQDEMQPQEVHLRPQSLSGHQRPVSVHDPVRHPHSSSPVRSGYRTNINLGAVNNAQNQEYLPQPLIQPPTQPPPAPYTPASPSKLYPSSPIKEHPQNMFPSSPTKTFPPPPGPSYFPPQSRTGPSSGAPLDRPTAVRHVQPDPYNNIDNINPRENVLPADNDENIKLVPSMADKPTGLQSEDFLPEKFGKMSIFGNSGGGSRVSNFDWPQTDLSESEVTSSILKGHSNMMTVLTTRSRNIDITRQLWHSKDAKTAVEQAVSFNDPSIIVDLLSVIVLRPSIWNLDLCLILIPSIGELLLSKYETYINSSANALKLILKNFATVIKSNIDQPTSVGVDISKEERATKCMDCYRELIKIRSGILKRQKMQGKAGHSYRELAILMQYLD